jgi:hypothetical protein
MKRIVKQQNKVRKVKRNIVDKRKEEKRRIKEEQKQV